MNKTASYLSGITISAVIALCAYALNSLLPGDIIGPSVLALLLGMALNPLVSRLAFMDGGIAFTSKKILKLGIVLMGVSLSFTQVMNVGKYALIVMAFTLVTAFGIGNLVGRMFRMDWKLTNLLSVSTAICGGSAVAAVGPVINARNSDIAYAISATFIFDIITVILFPVIGRALGMDDMGYGLWTGTAVNDTSSVVAVGYGFSDIAGGYAVIVKLTRTLLIIPVVLIFSFINERVSPADAGPGNVGLTDAGPTDAGQDDRKGRRLDLKKIFPWFILFFLGMVALKSTGILPETAVKDISLLSKFFMAMALGAIGLRTSFSEIAHSGFKPMILGLTIDTLVVFVALGVIALLVV